MQTSIAQRYTKHANHTAMCSDWAAASDWDGYDWWQLISDAGTAASLLALLAKPRLAGNLGKVATLFGAASTLHAIVTPPRCGRCGNRMSRPQSTYPGGPTWVCGCGNAIYPAN